MMLSQFHCIWEYRAPLPYEMPWPIQGYPDILNQTGTTGPTRFAGFIITANVSQRNVSVAMYVDFVEVKIIKPKTARCQNPTLLMCISKQIILKFVKVNR